ncbi:MAG: hypothetical protein ABW154_08260 [Dyella sp.]
MRSTTRYIALGLAGLLLAACHHKDKDAPLAFVPADTPYVLANLDVMDDDTRQALLAQADQQLPLQLQQLKSTADDMADKDPDSARLLRAIIKELDGKSIASFAQNAGLNIKGRSALYGVGLSPVLRFELNDVKAFEAFVARLETAYGKKLDGLSVGGQSYRRHIAADSGVQLILAVVGKQAVAAMLPADASESLLRQALGLDRPDKNIQDDDRLTDLSKAKGYQPWAVGQVDLTRLLPLIGSGKDPLFVALLRARAQAESAKTGEPITNLTQVPASCEADATRIAARIPSASFGYTKLDAKHQELRWDISLASDISSVFADLKVPLPGLGGSSEAPLDLSLALPVEKLRTFWTAQADAVADKPFGCPALSDLNDTFVKLSPVLQRTQIPQLNQLQGLNLMLDSFQPAAGGLPRLSGRLLIGSSKPADLLGTGQLMLPGLAQLKLTDDGKPVALPPSLSKMFGQPAFGAMNDKALALAIGAGQDTKLGDSLNAPTGNAGQLLRLHVTGDMYRHWVELMEARADAMAAASNALDDDLQDTTNESAEDKAAALVAAAHSKAQFEAMKAQASRIESINSEAHIDDSGLVITSQTLLK